MKSRQLKVVISFLVMMVVSCDEPETVVTNIVHPDGSVTRKIEMRNLENKFEKSDLQVPFDTTWIVRDSCEIDENSDTIWVKRAEKRFLNVDEINLSYKTDSGANKAITRNVSFKKTFKWFNTEYRFSEQVDKKMSEGYLLSDFLNADELLYFYSPENLQESMKNGTDSLMYRSLNDSVDMKVENWSARNLAAGWISEFSKLLNGTEGIKPALKNSKSMEKELADLVISEDDKIDSLWSNGIILRDFLGIPDYEKYKQEADSALELVSEKYWVDFKEYSVRIIIPGKLIGTNGFIDSSGILLWPVKSDYFLTERYEMWAKSKIPNRWAWIVSGIFLAFVLTGLIIRIKKRG